MLGCGPIKPTKSGNRLLWSEDAVIKLVACRDREREVRAYEKAAQEAEKAERKAAREAAKHAAN